MANGDENEKTEEATPERRRKAREQGQFAKAKDTTAVAATFAVLIALGGFGAALGELLTDFVAEFLRDPEALVRGNLQVVGQRTVAVLATLTLPVAVGAAIFAIGAGFLEAGYQPRLELAGPKWNRLDPINGLKRIFAFKTGTTNVLMMLARVAAVSGVTYLVGRHHFGDLIKLSRAPVAASANELVRIAMNFALWATLTLMLLSALDYILAHFRHEQSIRMSRQELKDELHQQEGDPKVRARQRQRAREIASRNYDKQVKQSDVVIANPTHIAVALRYRADEGAPVVNCKGYDDVALHIKGLAQKHNVMIVENKPLARALAKLAKVDKAIPVELYASVAEVLAFVYRAKAQKPYPQRP